jgi:hypothetical protein
MNIDYDEEFAAKIKEARENIRFFQEYNNTKLAC